MEAARDNFNIGLGIAAGIGGGAAQPESTLTVQDILPPLNVFSFPARAAGGPVGAGMPYIVGDGGRPELFVPNQSGYILPRVPAGFGGGGGVAPRGDTYHVTVQVGGSVVSEGQLVETVYNGLLAKKRSRPSLGLA